ncbi:MAG: hypothetical protein IK100_02040 [Muribaculaceae bacterium]|nr:hypothetical protein [Muribaculaceae bacterium]
MAQKTWMHVVVVDTEVTVVLDMVSTHFTVVVTGTRHLRFMDVNSI